jgi:hypothetical protein
MMSRACWLNGLSAFGATTNAQTTINATAAPTASAIRPIPLRPGLPTPVRDCDDPEQLDEESDRQRRHAHALPALHRVLASVIFPMS